MSSTKASASPSADGRSLRLVSRRAALAAWQVSRFKQPLLVLLPRNGQRRKNFPPFGDELCSVAELSAGIEEGKHGRAAARQRGDLGSSLDEPAFQTCQLRPPRENDRFKVIFGRSRNFRGKVWPRAKESYARGSAIFCQPASRFPVGLRCGNRTPGKNHQTMPPS